MNGTWRIRVVDYSHGGTGTVSAAGLIFFSNPETRTVGCLSAGSAVFAAAAALDADTRFLTKVKKNLRKAKRKQEGDRKIAKVRKKKHQAKRRVTASTSSLAAAHAAKSVSCA